MTTMAVVASGQIMAYFTPHFFFQAEDGIRDRSPSRGLGTPGSRTVAELESEILQLRKALNEARLERDILKKATAYFAQESLKNTR